jgi:hypothetical protein
VVVARADGAATWLRRSVAGRVATCDMVRLELLHGRATSTSSARRVAVSPTYPTAPSASSNGGARSMSTTRSPGRAASISARQASRPADSGRGRSRWPARAATTMTTTASPRSRASQRAGSRREARCSRRRRRCVAIKSQPPRTRTATPGCLEATISGSSSRRTSRAPSNARRERSHPRAGAVGGHGLNVEKWADIALTSRHWWRPCPSVWLEGDNREPLCAMICALRSAVPSAPPRERDTRRSQRLAITSDSSAVSQPTA